MKPNPPAAFPHFLVVSAPRQAPTPRATWKTGLAEKAAAATASQAPSRARREREIQQTGRLTLTRALRQWHRRRQPRVFPETAALHPLLAPVQRKLSAACGPCPQIQQERAPRWE